MSVTAATDLRSLKDQPFDLLQEMERRSKAAMAGAAGDDINVEEWVGIGFRLGEDQFIVARDEVREVLMIPSSLSRVPGSKPWIRGLANVRGHLLPIADLRAFLGGGAGGVGRTARALVLNSPEFPVGLIVDEVFGFRRFLEREHSADAPETVIRCDRFIAGAYQRGEYSWPVFSMERLLEGADFRRAAED
jgi:twitching motility protein PilI